MKRPVDSYSWSRVKRTRHMLHRGLALAGLLARLALASRGDERQQTFDRLCDFMLQTGGVYTKFLQGVLLGVPEVRDWTQRRGVDFFENVPTEDIDINEVLANELGEGVARLHIWPDVLASGTFSQVYAGILDFDIPVVIKVQRQTIRPSLKADVWLLKRFVRYGRPFLTTLDADIRSISRDFARLTLAEMDYEREVRLGETLRERVIDAHANLVVPRSFADMSTEHILVQERIGGTSVAEIMRNPEPPTPAQRQTLQETVTAVLLLPFSTGLVHADPHPGNIRLLDDGRIALLDFGAIDDKLVDLEVYRRLLTATVKAMDGTMTAAEALEAYFAAYAPKLYRAMEVTSQALGLPPVLPLLAKASMGKDTANTPQSSFKGSLLALADINKLVNPNNRFRLRGSLQNVSYARAIHTVTQTLQIMGLQDEIAAALYYIHDRLQNNQAPAWEAQRNNGLSTTEAKEIVYGWLEEVLEHNPLMIGELANIFETLRGSITEQHSREV